MQHSKLTTKICDSVMYLTGFGALIFLFLYALEITIGGLKVTESTFTTSLIFLFIVMTLASTIKSLVASPKKRKTKLKKQ